MINRFYAALPIQALAFVAVTARGLTAACSDSKSSMNPTAPSAVVADGSQSDQSGGVSTATKGKPANPGNGNGNGNGNGKGDDNGGGNGNNGPGNGQPAAPSPTQPSTTTGVELEGLIGAKSGDSILVNAQSITVPLDCVIRHGNTRFTFADLHVGDRVHVKGTRTTTGAGATMTTKIEASEVKLQNPGDGNDDGEDDGPTNLVSVTAFDPVAIEVGANTGTFRLTRSGNAALLASPLTVTFTLTGTAGNGTDYQSLPLTATFAAGAASTDVVVSPIADGVTESAETVILTLTSVAPYEVGSPAVATVTISDTDSPLVSASAFDGTASETGPNLGTFRFTRTGSTAAALAVTFTITGSADNGIDYQTLPTTVTFLAGQATVDLAVFPLADGIAEGIETVTVTITDGAAYDVGTQAAATVNIAG